MKSFYMIGLAALSLMLMTGSCQNEELLDAGTSSVGQVLTMRAAMGSYVTSQTRAQVELGKQDGTGETFQWNEGDSFTLYDQGNPTGVSSVFTISGYTEIKPSAEASFVGDNIFEEGINLTAIYPAQTGEVVGNDNVATLILPDVSMTDGTDNDWKNYMSQRMYMYANATLSGENPTLSFQHLCAMIRVSYTNATAAEQSISKVTLTGDDNYFGSALAFNFADNTTSTLTASSAMTLNFSAITIAPGKTIDFYFLFFPGSDASTGTLSISLDDYKVDMSLSELLTENFAAGKRYWFSTIQTSEGLTWSKNLPGETITNLPLIELIEHQNYTIKFIKDANGFVNTAINENQINQVTSLTITDGIREIDKLDGLEYLTNLQVLFMLDPKFTALDVSTLVNLEQLYCDNGTLESLDVSSNTKLTNLDCSRTKLTELDLTHNPELTQLSCSHCQLENLDLSRNTKLELLIAYGDYRNIDCPYYNLFTSLDLSNNTELRELRVDGSLNLNTLNISNCSKLEILYCNKTALTSLDVSNLASLKTLWCGDTQITHIDLSKNLNLTMFECQESLLTEIDLSNNLALTTLYLANSEQLNEIDVSGNQLLTDLSCNNTAITELDLSNNPALVKLSCMQNALISLDLSNNLELTELDCWDCNLTELDITKNQKLNSIRCGNQRDAMTNRNIDMTLYLTTEQKQNLWDLNMELEAYNQYVIPHVYVEE